MKKYSACEDIYHAVECVDNSEKRSDIFNLISIDGDVEFYIAREADEELRATKRALWMARAKICELERLTTLRREWEWSEGSLEALEKAERKCREKAEEYR